MVPHRRSLSIRPFFTSRCTNSWLLFVMFNCLFLSFFPCGMLSQVWFLIVSIPDLHSYFQLKTVRKG